MSSSLLQKIAMSSPHAATSRSPYVQMYRRNKVLYCIDVLYRIVDGERLRSLAEKIAHHERDFEVTSEHRLLVPHKHGIWGDNYKVNSKSICLEVSGHRYRPRSDATYMRDFLNASERQDVLLNPNLVNFDDLIPCGAPIIDFLSAEIQYNQESWAYPTPESVETWRANRGLSPEYPDKVEVRELIAGESTEEEVKEFATWAGKWIAENQAEMPNGMISLDVEFIKVTYFDYIRMAKPEMLGKDLKLAEHRGVYEDSEADEFRSLNDHWVNFPVKIMFGDGINWAGMVSLPVRRASDAYVFRCIRIPITLVALLNCLPTCMGVGIRNDVLGIQNWYTHLSGVECRMENGFLDLASLATFAGWQLMAVNMTAMAMITLGSTMNKEVSAADGMWGLPYHQLPHSLKAYAVADLKFGYCTCNVLLACLLREFFPDPEVCLALSDCDQKTYVKWFCNWMFETLRNTEFYAPAKAKATTREELIDSLRYRDLYGNLSTIPASRVQTAATLLDGLVPVLTKGGARYLHTVRHFYLNQFHVLHLSGVNPELFSSPLSSEKQCYARFGHPHLDDINAKAPIDKTQRGQTFTLAVPRELLGRVIDPDPGSLSFNVLCDEVNNANRDMRYAVFEWARLNVRCRVPLLFKKIDESPGFSYVLRSYYEGLRLIYFRVVDKNPGYLPMEMERIKRKHVDDRLQLEYEKREKLREMLAESDKRIAELEQLDDPPPALHREKYKADPYKGIHEGGVKKSGAGRQRCLGSDRTRGHLGRPLEAQHADHSRVVSIEKDFLGRQPWKSNVKANPNYAPPVWQPGFEPPSQMPDEHAAGTLATGSGKKRRGAELVSSGKRRGQRQMTQDEWEESEKPYENCFF